MTTPMGAGAPAELGTRFVAYLIDVAILIVAVIAVVILSLIFGAISESLGGIVAILGYLGIFALSIWNMVIRQGQTGQSIGKAKQGIKLVADATGQPVGAGMSFVRYVLGSVLSNLCLAEFIYIFMNPLRKRLSDKILNFNVIKA